MEIAVNGITLNVEITGSGDPLLLLHGFTGSTATWNPFVPRFGSNHRMIAVDILGHGRSSAPSDPERYRMDRCVADLLAVLDALEIPRTDLLGYSMGGRVALQLAAAARARIRRLVLESGSPGLASAAEREARVASDEVLAANIDRDGLDAFIDFWERVPLFASQVNLPAEVRARLRAQRLQSNPVGLAGSLRGMGTGSQLSLWDRLATLHIPTLIVVGDLDQRYCEIGRQMAAALPAAQVEVIENAGHATHLEQPEAFASAVLGFLEAGSLAERSAAER